MTVTLYGPATANKLLNVEIDPFVIFSVNAGTLLMNQSIVKLEPSGSTTVALKSTEFPSVVTTGDAGVVSVMFGACGTGGGITVVSICAVWSVSVTIVIVFNAGKPFTEIVRSKSMFTTLL